MRPVLSALFVLLSGVLLGYSIAAMKARHVCEVSWEYDYVQHYRAFGSPVPPGGMPDWISKTCLEETRDTFYAWGKLR